jgi:hypothetical protein
MTRASFLHEFRAWLAEHGRGLPIQLSITEEADEVLLRLKVTGIEILEVIVQEGGSIAVLVVDEERVCRGIPTVLVDTNVCDQFARWIAEELVQATAVGLMGSRALREARLLRPGDDTSRYVAVLPLRRSRPT